MLTALPAPALSCKVVTDGDVVLARQLGRKRAEEMGFNRADQAQIATAISELARNIVNYTPGGKVEVTEVVRGRRKGLRVTVSDSGPGIVDVDLAMADGYSTGKSLGLGLPGTKRLVDEFQIASPSGEGLTVSFIKWLR